MDLPVPLQELVIGLDHVAIAVHSIAQARTLYEVGLGLTPAGEEHVPGQRVNVLMLMAGTQRIELVEPASEDSPITKFLATRGEGIHHLAWQVANLEATLEHLLAQGVRLIHSTAQAGAHGTRIAFVHPSSTGGVLMELVELPAADPKHHA
ncbi:MAG: methylmalonyl-CoA epimerase [Planctomycetes bacterium]|nr:methylmalonyl-CoA epimerase [Planctomycetota bacterium]MCB9913128.1 methylmalonyl-CoA epimerase [Planctomycetota bacterium]HRV82048.1 methylmalonyl-CoA epimerase [Planctomycetota bacterium]